jgi:hypothetical protein
VDAPVINMCIEPTNIGDIDGQLPNGGARVRVWRKALALRRVANKTNTDGRKQQGLVREVQLQHFSAWKRNLGKQGGQ